MRSEQAKSVIDLIGRFWPRLTAHTDQVAAFYDGLERVALEPEQCEAAVRELFRTHKGHPSAGHIFERFRNAEPRTTYTDAPDTNKHGTEPMPPVVDEWRAKLSGMIDDIEVATADVVAREWLLFRWRQAATLDDKARDMVLLMLLRIARVTWTGDHSFPSDARTRFAKVDKASLVRRMAELFGVPENHPMMARAMRRPVPIPGPDVLKSSFVGTTRQEQYERKVTIRELAEQEAAE